MQPVKACGWQTVQCASSTASNIALIGLEQTTCFTGGDDLSLVLNTNNYKNMVYSNVFLNIDYISYEKFMKAVKMHTQEKWILLYRDIV